MLGKEKKYRNSLVSELNDMVSVVQDTEFVSQVLDEEWRENIFSEIQRADLNSSFESTPSCMFIQLKNNHDLIDLMEKRLNSLHKLVIRQDVLAAKISELRRNRFVLKYREALFELMVLGAFAEFDCLSDIEVPVGNSNSTIDGEIELSGRAVFCEVTFTSQELFQSPVDGAVFVSIEEGVQQVIKKAEKKACRGKQLALVEGVPSILVLGLNFNGADDYEAGQAIEHIFRSGEFANISAVITSLRWGFISSKLYINSNASSPLRKNEEDVLRKICP